MLGLARYGSMVCLLVHGVIMTHRYNRPIDIALTVDTLSQCGLARLGMWYID